jgi:hypothetical protein
VAWRGAQGWDDSITVERHDPSEDEEMCGDLATVEEPDAMSPASPMPQPKEDHTDYERLS